MAKKLIQDIFVKKNAPSGAAPERRTQAVERTSEQPARRPPVTSSPRSPLLGKKRFWLSLVAIFVAVFFFVATSFSSATLTLTPRSETVVADGVYTLARKDTEGAIHYEVMTLDQENSLSVPANGVSKVEKKAKGTIIVYNAFDSKPQKLVAGTRFATSDGKIYKADSTITVPGMKGSTAGSVIADVTAAETGDEYNIGLSDFTIPGFKDSPRYAKFYARSKTEMIGGAKGNQPIAKDTDILDARHKLEDSLKTTLLDRSKKETPDGYLFYVGSDTFSIAFLPNQESASSTDSLIVRAKGTLSAIILEKASLARVLALKKVPGYTSETVDIANPESLNFAFAKKDPSDTTPDSIGASLTGSAKLVWAIDEESLRADIAGISKADFQNVLKNHPEINRAEASFNPPWIFSFPKDPKSLHFEYPEGK